MKPIIEVSHLSKRYQIRRDNESQYATLVETLSAKARHLIRAIKNPKTYQRPNTEEFWAVKDLSFTIEEGAKVCIIGSNGAGKSTLLKLLSRITAPTAGRIRIEGRITSLLEVGTGFHPELTGRENIFLNGSILGMSNREIKQKFDEIVAFADVAKFIDTPVKRYSSGMYTRLGFAIAAYLDPDILIVDEVLAVGDAAFQEKCLKKLNDLGTSGRTVIFVSHDVGAVLALCDTGIYLDKGRLIEQGPVEQCINRYMRQYRLCSHRWTGDQGDDHVRFYSAKLVLQSPEREYFYQHEPVTLEVDYEVLKPCEDLVLGVGVWNQRNQLLARSLTCDDSERFQQHQLPGRKRATFAFDSNLFHEGDYLVKLDCALHNRRQILRDDVILKYQVYPSKVNSRFGQLSEGKGVYLGNGWSLS
jgi:lipopolysaccharide transport system ATP-binding protein